MFDHYRRALAQHLRQLRAMRRQMGMAPTDAELAQIQALETEIAELSGRSAAPRQSGDPPVDRTADTTEPVRSQAPPKRAPGRPTRRDDIRQAHGELCAAGTIGEKTSGRAVGRAIRRHLTGSEIKVRGSGLGDAAIHNALKE